VSVEHTQKSQTGAELEERIRSILALRDLNLSQVSRRLEKLYGHSSPYFVPHNFYYDLRGGSFSPSIHQLAGLSRITGYRLEDWLQIFGANPESIPRLQVMLPSRRTILLDSSLANPYAWVPWFENQANNMSALLVAPLAQLLRPSGQRQIDSFRSNRARFVYAKIGSHDTLAFPDLLPGSIVRVNTDIPDELIPRESDPSHRYFLIDHSRGLFCCRLRSLGNSAFVPVSTKLPYAQVELKRPQEAKLIGVADLELRPLFRFDLPTVPDQLARQWKPQSLSEPIQVGPLLRYIRGNMEMSFREVSGVSRKVANILNDHRYFLSPSSLCDYELLNTSPRRLQTAISLCSVYGLPFRSFLRAIDIDLDQAGTEPLPDHLIARRPRLESTHPVGDTTDSSGFLGQLLKQCEEIPFFLRQSLASLSGLKDPSLDDFFWIGGRQDVLHPYLANGLLAIVNRRRKKPIHFASKMLCQQPVYVLLKRDGTYLCACCGLEGNTVVVHPYSKDFHHADVFRYHHDVEVVGQIVMVARKLV
jgi:hypothetical protein